jgi:hypothetical protein
MVRDYAEGRAGMPGACPEGSGRKPREQGPGASSAAAPPVVARPEATARLLEVFLDRVPRLRVAPKSVARFKGKLRALWRQGRGRSLTRTIEDLAPCHGRRNSPR